MKMVIFWKTIALKFHKHLTFCNEFVKKILITVHTQTIIDTNLRLNYLNVLFNSCCIH